MNTMLQNHFYKIFEKRKLPISHVLITGLFQRPLPRFYGVPERSSDDTRSPTPLRMAIWPRPIVIQGGGRSCAYRRLLLPSRRQRSESVDASASRPRSAASFLVMTASQNEAIDDQHLSLSSICETTVDNDRSIPSSIDRTWRWDPQAGQTSNVWRESSIAAPHSWHPGVPSLPILCRYLPKTPCPVST